MICQRCRDEGRKSTVTQVRAEVICVPAVYYCPRWDEEGRRVELPDPPRPKAWFECSEGHSFQGEA